MKTFQHVVKSMALIALPMFFLAACAQKGNGTLLCGTIEAEGDEVDFAINYMPEGNLFETQTFHPEIDSTGCYSFTIELPHGTADVDVMIGSDLYAAHLEEGKTARLDFKQQADGTFTCQFGGDNADVSEALSLEAQANDLFSMQEMSNAESRTYVKNLHRQALEKAAAIKDAKLRDYYTQLFEARYKGTMLRIMGDVEKEADRPTTDEAEMKALLESIDPNSDIDYLATNSILWIGYKTKSAEPTFKGDYSGYCIEQMNLVDSVITNEHFRKQMAYCIANTFFAYGDHETGKEEFWTRYKEFAKDYPQYIEAFEAEYHKVIKSMDGEQVPDIMLEQPDGKKVSIQSLRGKYTYIDIWATWCGPCCKEIPFVEKLVEQMKDNSRLQFVSFSVDADREAWKAKLEKDHPAWTQFILDEQNNQIFSDALGITGIPRFVVLGPDGTIVNQEAPRPSDPGIVDYLTELTK